MSRVFRCALPKLPIGAFCAVVAGLVSLSAAAPSHAIAVCGDGVCDGTAFPPENITRCPVDCGGGGDPTGCTRDTCSSASCGLPANYSIHYDNDGVPERLEYELAHKFFPHVLLQWHDVDRAESYLYQNRAIPYTLRPFNDFSSHLCDEAFECLEIRWGVAFDHDHGDVFGATWHFGDSEMYAGLVRRLNAWSWAQTNLNDWRLIRDFTTAHWGTSSDSSKVGAYGDCPVPCSAFTNDTSACNARPTCSGGGWCSGGSWCSGIGDGSSCQASGCTWMPYCIQRFPWACLHSSGLDVHTTVFAAESKHGLYHSDSDCDNGGFWGADDCPTNQYDMREWKTGKLQNVGNLGSTGNQFGSFDVLIQHPNMCDLYDVWGGAPFAESTAYRTNFTNTLRWALGVN